MNPAILNLHNHTPWSDGALEVGELCQAHAALPFRVDGIGVCDHLFRTPTSRAIADEREFEQVFAGETRRYIAGVRAVQSAWRGRLEVYCGAEVHWGLNRPHLEAVRRLAEGLDYVLFECIDWAGLTQLANQARRWPCPVGLAHADVPAQFPSTSMDQVVRTLANARIFFELNSKHLPLAERDPWFDLLPRHRVGLAIGTDTHDDPAVLNDIPMMVRHLERRGLLERLITPGPRAATQVAQSA